MSREFFRKDVLLCYTVALFVIIFDRLTKILALNYISAKKISIIGNIVTLTLVQNMGAGFGILQGFGWMFILISAIVAIFLLYLVQKIKASKPIFLAIGLLLGGTIGNMIDRIIYGHVVDFIDIWIWPTFNIADSMITVSMIIIVYYMIYEQK